jgi:MFS family permease
MENKKTVGRIYVANWIAIILLGFSGQLAWAVENQFFNTFMYEEITPDPRPISWMVSTTAVVALFTTILMGNLSDGFHSRRWGKRRLFMLFGYIGWGIFTALYPVAGIVKSVTLGIGLAILFDSIMSFFGSTANDAAFNAFITDITTNENRGKVVGIAEILRWVALLVTYGGAGFLVVYLGYFGFFVAIGLIVIVMGVIGGLILKEPVAIEPPTLGYWQRIANTFQWKSLQSNRNLLMIFIAVLIWNLSFNIFFPYLLIYLQHYLKLTTIISSIVVAVAVLVGGIAMGYPLGILTDRWGRRNVSFAAVIVEVIGLLLFSISKSIGVILFSGILWVMAIAAWSIATAAWEKDLFPDDSRGQYQGWEILFRVTLAMTLGPLLGGWLAAHFGNPIVIDGKPGFVPPPLLFQAAAVGILLVILPLLKTKETKNNS